MTSGEVVENHAVNAWVRLSGELPPPEKKRFPGEEHVDVPGGHRCPGLQRRRNGRRIEPAAHRSRLLLRARTYRDV